MITHNFFLQVISGKDRSIPARILWGLLWVASLGYGLVVALRNALFDRKILRARDLGRPVISIGNITWGGTGKTPFAQYVAERLLGRTARPAILNRGYHLKSSGVRDEAQMLKQQLADVPVGVGADRVLSAEKILAARPVDVFILDDGFQHRQVKRDLDVVLIDAANPFGNGHLIPAGILREPVSQLRRADVVVLSKTHLADEDVPRLKKTVQTLNPGALIVQAAQVPAGVTNLLSQEDLPVTVLKNRRVIAFCGIADPNGFAAMLRDLGADIVQFVAYRDHCVYDHDSVRILIEMADKESCSLVTTAKDQVKLEALRPLFGQVPCWILKIKNVIETDHHEFDQRINQLLGR